MVLCLLICLFGCQTKQKDIAPLEPYEKKTERYHYTLEPMHFSDEFTSLVSEGSPIQFLNAYNGKLLFEQKDDAVTDQIGKTKALYEYDLTTQNLQPLELPYENVKVWDAIYYQDHYIYILKNKDSEVTTIVSENKERTVLFEEEGISFMGYPRFVIAEDGLYYRFYQELENQHFTKYQKITPDLKVESIWEKEDKAGEILSVVYYSKNAAVVGQDESKMFLKGGKGISIDGNSENMEVTLFENYLFLNATDYYDLSSLEKGSLTNQQLPNEVNSKYIDHDTMIYKDSLGQVHAVTIIEDHLEDEIICQMDNANTSFAYYPINDQDVLVVESYSKMGNQYLFYKLHQEVVEE